MVGFHEEDSLHPGHKLFAGCLAGVIQRAVTQPIDILKTKIQLQSSSKKSFHSMTNVLRAVYAHDGLRGFYRGHRTGQVHSIISYGTQFLTYDFYTMVVTSNHIIPDQYTNVKSLVCGTLSGLTTAAIVNPIEVLRVRQMMLPQHYDGLIRGAVIIVKHGGVRALYEGLAAHMIQIGGTTGIGFAAFNLVQTLVLNTFEAASDCQKEKLGKGNTHKAYNVAVASVIGGTLSGIISKVLMYPVDLFKKRLQMSRYLPADRDAPTTQSLFRCKTLVHCWRRTYRKEGFVGLFRGLGVSIIKAQVSSTVLFTSYEMICYVMRQLNDTF